MHLSGRKGSHPFPKHCSSVTAHSSFGISLRVIKLHFLKKCLFIRLVIDWDWLPSFKNKGLRKFNNIYLKGSILETVLKRRLPCKEKILEKEKNHKVIRQEEGWEVEFKQIWIYNAPWKLTVVFTLLCHSWFNVFLSLSFFRFFWDDDGFRDCVGEYKGQRSFLQTSPASQTLPSFLAASWGLIQHFRAQFCSGSRYGLF